MEMDAMLLVPRRREVGEERTEPRHYIVVLIISGVPEGATGFKGLLNQEGLADAFNHLHVSFPLMPVFVHAFPPEEATTWEFAAEPYPPVRPRYLRLWWCSQATVRPVRRRRRWRVGNLVRWCLALTSASNAECCACNPGWTTARAPRQLKCPVPPRCPRSALSLAGHATVGDR